jgi:hypothetical protein
MWKILLITRNGKKAFQDRAQPEQRHGAVQSMVQEVSE